MKSLLQLIWDTSAGIQHPFFRIGAGVIVLGNLAALVTSDFKDLEPLLKSLVLLATLAVSALHIIERITRRKPTRKRPLKQPRIIPPLPLPVALCLLSILMLTGCTALRSTTYDPDTQKRTSSMSAVAVFDAHGTLSKFHNSPKTGTSIGSLDGTATSTNLNNIISAIVSSAIQAAK